MTKKRSDQAILITIALALQGKKPRNTLFDEDGLLIELDYSFSRITQLPPEIGLLANLQRLYLQGNLLKRLPPEIGTLSKLTRLYLPGNNLEALPQQLWNLTALEELGLGLLNSRSFYYGYDDDSSAEYDDVEYDDVEYDDVEYDDVEYDDEEDDGDRYFDKDGNYREKYSGDYFYHQNFLEAIAEGRHNNISVLSSGIGRLLNLEILDLTFNELKVIPREIGFLQELHTLKLGNNKLTGLPVDIGLLKSLERLFLQDNQLFQLPKEIAHLSELELLQLESNKLQAVPVEIGHLSKLNDISLSNNPDIVVPPPEIATQGTSQILKYLVELEKDSITRYEAKMLLVGEGGTGKSTLLQKLRGEETGGPLSTTHGIEIGVYNISDPNNPQNEITLNTWDFGGQQIYHATHQFFLTKRSLYLVVWNARLGAEQGRLHYWLDTIKALAPDSPVLLVATHIDERAPDLNYHLYKEAYPQLVGSVNISNTTRMGLSELSSQIATIASNLPLMGQPWPEKWISAEKRLLTMTDHHIGIDEYVRCCQESGVEPAVAHGTLGDFLHDLGKIVYFRDDYILRNLIILKPNWVTKAISLVLTDDATGTAKGILSHSELPRIWREDEAGNAYDHHLYSIFLRLMERFDLSYQIEADLPGNYPTRSLVPQLLPHEPPLELAPWPQKPLEGESLVEMLYKLDFVPAGIMSWFIVRTHRYTTNLHWREGVLLEYEGHQARVELNPMLRDLKIAVWGSQPYNFFTILKNTLDLILSRFEGIGITRGVPCICHWRKKPARRCPRYYPYEDLVKRMTAKKLTIECPQSFQDVDVPLLLYGIHTSTDAQVMDSIKQGYLQIQKRLGGLDQILDNLNQLSELLVRNFTRGWNLEMQKLEAECPSTFWLATAERSAFNPKDWVSQQYRLYLLCQHPTAPHTVGDGYQLRQSQEWWLTLGPWLNHLIKFIKYGVPMGKAVGLVYDESAFKNLENQADLMEEITKAIPQLSESTDARSFGLSRPDLSYDQQAIGAALRAIYHFLNQVDPSQFWGGLSRVVTPDGNILWLCNTHRQQYEARPLVLNP